MEPWNPYLADVRLGVDANLPKLSLKALKCLNERLKNTSTFQCCHSFELHRFQCSIKTIQELQKERVREQELVQKQKVPRDLRITYGILGWFGQSRMGLWHLWKNTLKWFLSKSPLLQHFRRCRNLHAVRIVVPHPLDIFTDPHCGHATRRKNWSSWKSRKSCSRTILVSGARG